MGMQYGGPWDKAEGRLDPIPIDENTARVLAEDFAAFVATLAEGETLTGYRVVEGHVDISRPWEPRVAIWLAEMA